MNEKTVLTMAECMDLLGVSKSRIKLLIHEKELDPVYIKNPDMRLSWGTAQLRYTILIPRLTTQFFTARPPSVENRDNVSPNRPQALAFKATPST